MLAKDLRTLSARRNPEINTLTDTKVFKASRVANPGLSGWLTDHAVVVVGEVISDVMPTSALPSTPDVRVYDLGDVSMLPGIVEAHSHVHCSATYDAYDLMMSDTPETLMMRAVTAVRKALMSGVTTMRDLGSPNEVAFPLKDAVESGAIPGPRLMMAGTPITITSGHCNYFGTEADTVEEVVTAVRTQVKLGARVIKMMATGGNFTPTSNTRRPQYPVETLRAAVREAERHDVQIVAHTHAAQGVRNCVEAGIQHLIHSRWLSVDPTKGFDYDHELATRMADEGRWVDATIGAVLLRDEAADQGLPERPLHWSVIQHPPNDEEAVEILVDMRQRGVRFTNGLDMGMAYADFDKSCATSWAAVEWLGYTPWEALSGATAETAEALGLHREIGSLTAGKYADIATFEGDPAEDIRRLDVARDVVKGGKPVKLNGEALV